MGRDTARTSPAQARKPSFDGWLRFDPRTAIIYEHERRDARITHIRKTIFFGVIVYNIYAVSNALLMPDIARESAAIRLLIGTPMYFAVAWIIADIPATIRENLLVIGLLGTHALPLGLFWVTQSELGAYSFGEIALTVIYGNMLLALRFPHAVFFTIVALLMTLAVVATKPQLPLELQLAFTLQLSIASIFSLYANYLVERRRCEEYTNALTSTQRAELAERRTEAHQVISKTDTLTNLPNRRHLDEQLNAWFQSDQGIAILMIDIDHFKLFNDSLGHPAGDDCLRQIAGVFRKLSAPDDIFCARFGGEEFTMVMRNATEQDAAELARKTVIGIAALAIVHPGRDDGISIVTTSVGVAHKQKGSTDMPKDLMLQADNALYQAKRIGRNGFVVAGSVADQTAAITESNP